jgi:MerR family transcriptional regulator, light-induced transcriptional regulator
MASTGNSTEQSIFAGIRRHHPGLRVHILNKRILLAVTRAIEDECGARAQHPVLLGSFQRQRFYRSAAPRWADLARTAEQTVIFADFGRSRLLPGPVAEVRVPEDSPLRREWALICDAPDTPACVTAWERPGQDRCRDQDRMFEVLWSVDPQVVRSAARIGTGLAAAAIPEITERLAARLREEPDPSSADLRRASGLIERTLDYLAGAGQPAPG